MKTSLRPRQDRDALVERYLPLVRHVVGRLPIALPPTLDRDDLCSSGVIGLIHAAETYDETRGASFKTFAYTAIRGAILDEVRKHDPLPRGRRERLRRIDRVIGELHVALGRDPTYDEIAATMGIRPEELDGDLAWARLGRTLSFDELASTDDDESDGCCAISTERGPLEAAETRDAVDHLAEAIAGLPETERRAVVLYHFEQLYLKEIGELLGVSESRVCQVLSRAMGRLQVKLRASERSVAI